MKKALKLVLMYTIFYFAAVVVGTFLYTLYMDVIGFIAGQKLNFFDFDQILRALFIVCYSVCFLMCPFMNYYRIRHPYGVPQLVAFILLTLFTFGGLFPGLHFLEMKIFDVHPTTTQISHLSGGYFRKAGDKVYYFTRDFYSNPYTNDHTNTIVIDTSDNGEVTFEKIEDNPEFELYEASKPYNEVQAKESFSNKYYDIGLNIRLLIDKGLECYMLGWSFFIGFCSIALVLASLYAFTAVFTWKLIDTTFVLIASLLIMCINTFFYSPASAKVMEKFYGIGFINWLQKIFDNPAIVIINVVVSLIFIITGVVRFIVLKHKAKAKAEE